MGDGFLGLLSTLVGTAGGVAVAYIAKRRPHGDLVEQLNRRNMIHEDYELQLRQQLIDAGQVPKPWPASLTTDHSRSEE